MRKQNIVILALVLIFVFGLFSLWQYSIYQKLSKTDMSCGGDWSYNVRCPVGSYCQSLGQGTLAGGLCKPFLSPLFGYLDETGGIKPVQNFPTPIPTTKSKPTPQDLLMYTTENGKYSFLYKGDLQITEEKPEYYENLISIKKDKKYINSIAFYPPKANSKFDNLEEDIKEGRGIFDTVGLEVKHIIIAGQSALLFNKNPEGGLGPVAYVKLEDRYIEFIGLGNEDSFNTIVNSFKPINQK